MKKPKSLTKPKIAKFILRIPESEMKRLKVKAKKWGCSVNATIGAILTDWLDNARDS